MLIDFICERMDGEPYTRDSYRELKMWARHNKMNFLKMYLSRNDEWGVKAALALYVKANEYNPDIHCFIYAVPWTKFGKRSADEEMESIRYEMKGLLAIPKKACAADEERKQERIRKLESEYNRLLAERNRC